APFNGDTGQESLRDLRRAVRGGLNVRMDTPYAELSAAERALIWEGAGEWYGIEGFFSWLEERRYKVQARIMIARYRGYAECPDCHGTRLVQEAQNIRIAGKNIGELCDLSVVDLSAWFDSLKLTKE